MGYTNLEQSETLKEMLPPESADMKWYFRKDEIDAPKVPTFGYSKAAAESYKGTEAVYLPCWSLDALIKLLPSEFTTENKFGIFKYTIRIRKYKFTEDIDVHQIAYGNYKYYEDGSSSWKDMINTGEKENLIDTAFDMIIWLKENKKL